MASVNPKLIVLSGPEQNKEFEFINKSECRLGRSDANDFVLGDTSVSRHHGSVFKKGDRWFYRDENSRNGSLVRDREAPVGQDIPLDNLDTIRVGAYELRFVLSEPQDNEIQDQARYQSSASEQSSESNKTQSSHEKQNEAEVQEGLLEDRTEPSMHTDKDELMEEAAISVHFADQKGGKSLRLFLSVALFFLLAGVGVYLYFSKHHHQHAANEISKTVKNNNVDNPSPKKNEVQQTSVQNKEVSNQAKPNPDLVEKTEIKKESNQIALNPKTQNVVVNQNSPVVIKVEEDKTSQDNAKAFFSFLDIKTTPLPAQVYLQDQRLGQTPLRKSLSFEPGKTYTVHLDFELRDIKDIYRKTLTFVPRAGADVIELNADAEIGVIKIQKLPRHTELYLEGYYDYDKEQAHPVKIDNVVYGKPIYVPYGRYNLELREVETPSGSQKTVRVIKYQREFHITSRQQDVSVVVTDEDLTRFPAVIRSNPTGADVVFQGQVLGQTPFEGYLPLGNHELLIRKEGYFETPLLVQMSINTLFEKEIELKTSQVGEFINQAKEKLAHAQQDDAVSLLDEALKYGGSRREKAEAYLLLGGLYLKLGQADVAISYLEKAKEHESFYIQALVVLAEAQYTSGARSEALKTIIEALVNLDDRTLQEDREQANRVFKLVSEGKSAMYLHTEPNGAAIYLNDKKQNEQTPAIIFGSDFRNFQIRFEKSGYEVYETKYNLKMGEFVLIRVDLTPVKL